jgi:hypothetical protein
MASWFSRRCEASSGDAFFVCTIRDGLAELGLLG